MKRALILASALTVLTLTGAGCAAKNDAPPPAMKTSYPSPDYNPQTEQATPAPTATPAPQAAAPVERPLAAPTAPVATPVPSDTPRPMPGASSGPPLSGSGGKPGGPMLLRLFDVMDTDHNGRVTMEEWRNFHEREFKRMDKNGDGVLTRDEMTAPPPMPGGPRPMPQSKPGPYPQ